MRKLSLFIEQAAKGLAPFDWELRNKANIQRLYYIKGGTGSIIGKDGSEESFKAGKVYIFPSNLTYHFITDRDDRVDHIYMDFYSTPPIVAPEPLVYDIQKDSAPDRLIRAIDSILIGRRPEEGRHDGYRQHDELPMLYGDMNEAEPGSENEYMMLIYSMLLSLLTMLSYIKELPVSDDEVVNEALDKIRARCAEPLSVSMLAAEAGFEVNHFIRRFRKVMGTTPYAYLRDYRLARAVSLTACGATLSEAAAKTGYENASSLSRAISSKKKTSRG